MNTPTFLSNHPTARIMRRVYAVWFLKKITSPLFVRFYGMIFFLSQLFRSVSVVDVLKNMAEVKLADTANYFLVSFTQTEFTVQVYVTLFIALGVWVMVSSRRRFFLVS